MWESMQPHLAPAMLAVLIVGTACGHDSPTQPSDPDLDHDGLANEVDACPNAAETVNNVFDTDGCPDTPSDLYLAVRVDAETFWNQEFAGAGLTYRGITGFTPYSSPLATSCGTLPLNNAIYCSVNEHVYYHSQFLDFYLAQIGDAAAAVIIAHEIGHHVSDLAGWFALRDQGLVTTKQLELQADCLAGAWLKSAGDRGLLETGDLEEAVLALFSVGDPDWAWFNPDGHGTAQQRGNALVTGLLGGSDVCDASIFPAAAVSPED